MNVVATIAAPASPYKGLAPFDDSDLDALLFFGRARETEIVAANVLASRLTVLYGPSGVGKSSLLRAGVVRSLRGAAEPAPAVVVYGSWAGDPLAGLEEAARAAVTEAIGREPADAPGSLADRLASWTAELGAELCLLLDQLEELFMYHPAERGAGGFAEVLPELVGRPGLRVNVLLGIRDDALAQLDAFKERIPALFANSLRLDHLDREAAREAILGPLDRYNAIAPSRSITIEPELVDAVLDEVQTGRIESRLSGRGGVELAPPGKAERAETPYLQLVMQRIWEVEVERGSAVLRLATFRDLGGAQRIVENHLERALQTLSPTERDAAASVFGYLVTPSGTKIAHGVSDLASYASLGEAELEPVLRSLAHQRILRPLGENGHSIGNRFEIFHDVLADPVVAWRTAHETQRQIEQERREAARRHKRLLVVVGIALAAMAAMSAVALFALAQREEARSQRGEARRQARQAHARELAANSVAQLQVDPARGLALAVDAVKLDRSRAMEGVLRRALLASRARAVLPSKGAVRDVAVSRDRRFVVTASHDGTARLFDPRTARELRVFRHGIRLEAVAISRDGRLVAAGGRGATALVWRTDDGKRVAVLRHGGAVTDLRFAADGVRLVTASADGSARVWDLESGGRRPLTLEHPTPVVSAAFDKSGTRIMTVAHDPYVRIFDATSGALLQTLEHPTRVTSADFSATGRFVVTGSIDGYGWIWYAERGERWKQLRGHRGPIVDVAFSPRGRLVATASTDGTARIWNVSMGTSVATLFGHDNHVVDVAFSDGHALVTAGKDRTALVWESRTGKPGAVLTGSGGSVTKAMFSPNGRTVITASDDGTARVWDPQIEPVLHVVARHGRPVQTALFAAGGRLAVSAGGDGTVRASTLGGREVARVRHGGPVRVLVIAPGGRLGASADARSVVVWRTRSGKRLSSFPDSARVRSMAFSPNARLVAAGTSDGDVRLWDRRNGRLLHVLRAHAGAVVAVSFSPDGRKLVTAGDDRKAIVWALPKGELLHELEGHRARLTSASFNHDGSRILTTSEDASARLWLASDGSEIAQLRGHTDTVTSGSFSADGSRVVTSSLDHDARLWNGETGAPVKVLRGHFAGVRRARFSPDGRWVVTAGPETAGLWQTATGRRLFYLRGHGGPLTDAAFSPDGTRILTASTDGTARAYRCLVCGDLDALIGLAERRLARLRR
jgi:WD40 repeat protein